MRTVETHYTLFMHHTVNSIPNSQHIGLNSTFLVVCAADCQLQLLHIMHKLPVCTGGVVILPNSNEHGCNVYTLVHTCVAGMLASVPEHVTSCAGKSL